MIKTIARSDAHAIGGLFAIPLLLFLLAHYFLEVEQYQFKVETLIEAESGQKLPLPLFKFIGFDDEAKTAPLKVTIVPPAQAREMDPSHLYFPFHAGEVKMSYNGEVFFDTAGSNIQDLPVLVTPLLLELPTNYASGDPIDMEISRKTTNALRASVAYFGDAEDFAPALRNHFLYYDFMGVANIGALIFTLLFLLTLSLTGSFKKEFRPLIFVVICMILFEAASIESIGFLTSKYWLSLLTLGPAMVIAAGKYIEDLAEGEINLVATHFLKPIIILTIIILALGASGELNLRWVNFLFSLPAMLAFCLIATYQCVKQAKKTNRKLEIYAFAMAMFSFSVSFAHDYIQRIGLINDNVLLTQVSFLTFFFVIAVIAVLDNERSQMAITMNNVRLETALNNQSKQLQSEFRTRTKLEHDKIVSEEKLRFHSDLHDGVLGYLANIHAVAELGKSENSETITKLSKNAINEIRVMMETDTGQPDASLFRTCSALSQQTIVPLRAIGVIVEWNTLALLNYTTHNPQINMEIFRILQEALHNATNRAKCKALSIKASQNEAGHFIIEVANSGGQTYSVTDRARQGIANMRRRAENIGAEFSIEPQEGGAIVRLQLPD